MIVLDASAAVELLYHTPKGDRVMVTILEHRAPLHAPEMLELEVLQVLRRDVASGRVTAKRAEQAIEFLASLSCRRHSHRDLLKRCWQLRHNLTSYDASYVALAELLQCALLTCDARMAAAPGIQAQVLVV